MYNQGTLSDDYLDFGKSHFEALVSMLRSRPKFDYSVVGKVKALAQCINVNIHVPGQSPENNGE